MNVPVKLAGFTLALGVVFASTYTADAFAGPVGATDPASHDMAGDRAAGHDGTQGHGAEAPTSSPGGLAVSADGYTPHPLGAAPNAGQPGESTFQILNATAS